MKTLSVIFGILAILISDVMCAFVAYLYCAMQLGAKYAGYSCPASAAFVFAVPFSIGIVICLVLAVVFKRTAAKR